MMSAELGKGKSCLIISGGEFHAGGEALPHADLVIACDKGYEYAAKLQVKADLLIGDFDSASMPELADTAERRESIEDGILRIETRTKDGTEILIFPSDKDDTDTMLAAKEAVKRGYREFFMTAALGGRLDHLFANIETGAYIAAQGGRLQILDRDSILYFLSEGSLVLPYRKGWSISLFSLSDVCREVSVSGAKFSGSHLTITNRSTLGTSNAFLDGDVRITLGEGILMVILSKLKDGEHN